MTVVVTQGSARVELTGSAATLCALVAAKGQVSRRIAPLCAALLDEPLIDDANKSGSIELHYADDGVKLLRIREKVTNRRWVGGD